MRRRAPALAMLAAVMLLSPSPARAVASVSATEYLERLDRARSAALAAVSAPSPERMRSIRSQLGLPLLVTLAGHQVRVETDPVLEDLFGNDPAEFRTAARRLAVLGDQARRALAARPVSPSGVRAALDEAYRGLSNPRPGLLTKLRRAFEDFLVWLGDRILNLRGPATIIAWLVLLALLLPLVPLARRLGVVPGRVAPAAGRTGKDQSDWYRLADEALARGDLHEAVRALYGSLLSSLSARGILPGEPSLTAGECRRAVAATQPTLYPVVETATTAFERVVYGRAAPRLEHVQALRAADRAARAR